ncbi:hypothetical protein N7G274_007267 [Stereocaulon virgatum]|uniref:Uncharacterized protein n=1 Tax=Stereocaulon virgatum TaxID=373712 RepID=A0ABR4A3H0_9LECA
MATPPPSSPRRLSLLQADAALQRPQVNPVDLRSLEYVDPYDHNLMCAICHSPFVCPVRLECDHVFCQRCVNDAMSYQDRDSRVYIVSCPSCRRKIENRAIAPVPKILSHILDDLRVKCPLEFLGCPEVTARGDVQDHVDKYCAYAEVECSSESCLLTVLRKDLVKGGCLHRVVNCEDCERSFMEKDLEIHRLRHCEVVESSCPDCNVPVLLRDIKVHIERCPNAILLCNAAEYGCAFAARRETLDEHLNTCPLAKLVPFLRLQNERLEAHEAALKLLRHKNSILETSFSTIQETLSPSANLIDAPSSSATASDTGPFDSTAHHLLCLHESLREEVSRVSAAVSEVDAKASMMVMNESLRIKEDLSHANAAIGSMRMQLHWLMSARLQNQQRVAMVRAQSSGEGLTSSADAGSSSGSVELPVRRLSDSTRQDTKL